MAAKAGEEGLGGIVGGILGGEVDAEGPDECVQLEKSKLAC